MFIRKSLRRQTLSLTNGTCPPVLQRGRDSPLETRHRVSFLRAASFAAAERRVRLSACGLVASCACCSPMHPGRAHSVRIPPRRLNAGGFFAILPNPSEREGFEPSVQSPIQLLSREPDSTALAPLQMLVPFYKKSLVECTILPTFTRQCPQDNTALTSMEIGNKFILTGQEIR